MYRVVTIVRGSRGGVGCVMLAVGVLAGCGDGSTGKADPAVEIAATVRGYYDDFIHGRGREACGALTPGFRAEGDAKARAQGVVGGCPEALAQVGSALAEAAPAGEREQFVREVSSAKVTAEVNGEDAVATAEFPPGLGFDLKRLALERVEEAWRISDLTAPASSGQ
jgi:hypothetical protein